MLTPKSGPTGRFAPDFGDIRKLMFTKFCDISSHNNTCKRLLITFNLPIVDGSQNRILNLNQFNRTISLKYGLIMSSTTIIFLDIIASHCRRHLNWSLQIDRSIKKNSIFPNDRFSGTKMTVPIYENDRSLDQIDRS